MKIQTTTTVREDSEPVLCPLADMGAIEVTGADAEAFLNAQLSRNVHSDQPSRATLAAWLDARGRVLALFRVLRAGDGWLLLTRGADVEALIRRLGMFVLRADVKLRDQSAQWLASAALGGIGPWLESRSIALGSRTGDAASANDTFFIRVGPRLVYLVSASGAPGESVDEVPGDWADVAPSDSAGEAQGDWAGVAPGNSAAGDAAGDSSGEVPGGSADEALGDWAGDIPSGAEEFVSLEEIRLGLVNLTPQLTGRYTAHMLNLDRLGALAFDKGCYPGQEVVARTQNLGAVKRRVFRFTGELEREPTVGTALLDSGGDKVGEVVRAVTIGESHVELLAMVRIDAASGVLTCATDASAPLTREALPWD